MLDGRPRRIVWCEVGVLTVIKGVGELRYNTFTSTRSNACFLVGIIRIITHILPVSTPFQHENQPKHKYFYLFTPKQVKSIEITQNQQETHKIEFDQVLLGALV